MEGSADFMEFFWHFPLPMTRAEQRDFHTVSKPEKGIGLDPDKGMEDKGSLL